MLLKKRTLFSKIPAVSAHESKSVSCSSELSLQALVCNWSYSLPKEVAWISYWSFPTKRSNKIKTNERNFCGKNLSNLTSFVKWVIFSVKKLEKKSKFKKKCPVNNLWSKWVVSYLTQNKRKKNFWKILWKSDKFHKMGHFPCRKVGK